MWILNNTDTKVIVGRVETLPRVIQEIEDTLAEPYLDSDLVQAYVRRGLIRAYTSAPLPKDYPGYTFIAKDGSRYGNGICPFCGSYTNILTGEAEQSSGGSSIGDTTYNSATKSLIIDNEDVTYNDPSMNIP